MPRHRRSPDSVSTLALAGLAALGGLACVVAAVLMLAGALPGRPTRLLTVAGLAVGLLYACVRLLQRVSRQPDANQLDPASELTTLTFPPNSRLDRPRLSRAK